MEQGKVAETCEKAGMKAVCWGDETCSVNKDDSRYMSLTVVPAPPQTYHSGVWSHNTTWAVVHSLRTL